MDDEEIIRIIYGNETEKYISKSNCDSKKSIGNFFYQKLTKEEWKAKRKLILDKIDTNKKEINSYLDSVG